MVRLKGGEYFRVVILHHCVISLILWVQYNLMWWNARQNNILIKDVNISHNAIVPIDVGYFIVEGFYVILEFDCISIGISLDHNNQHWGLCFIESESIYYADKHNLKELSWTTYNSHFIDMHSSSRVQQVYDGQRICEPNYLHLLSITKHWHLIIHSNECRYLLNVPIYLFYISWNLLTSDK